MDIFCNFVAKIKKMDQLSLIKQPIDQEFNEFTALFKESLTHGVQPFSRSR